MAFMRRKSRRIRHMQRSRRRHRGGASTAAGLNFPNNAIAVSFGETKVDGAQLPREVTAVAPTIALTGVTAPFCSVICFDPDATAPCWIHMFKANCANCELVTGTDAFEWTPPAPAKGIHKYIFGLFTHEYPMTEFPKERGYFDVAAFTKANGMRAHSAVYMKSA